MSLIRLLVLSVVVAVAVTLVCLLLGAVLILLKVEIAVVIGNFLTKYSAGIGILSGLWFGFVNFRTVK